MQKQTSCAELVLAGRVAGLARDKDDLLIGRRSGRRVTNPANGKNRSQHPSICNTALRENGHSALALGGTATSGLGFLGPFGSRLAASSSGVMEDWTPSAGTSALEIQRMALSTVLRKLSSPQLR